MRHHHHRQNDAGDDVAHDHLDEHDVSAVRDRGHANDRERAGLGGDDRHADAPPGYIAAAEKIVARIALIFSEPHPQADDPAKVHDDHDPVADTEITAHRGAPSSENRFGLARRITARAS